MSLPSIINKNNSSNENTYLKTNNTNSQIENDKEIEFWVNDPNVLFQKEYIFEFYPTKTMTYNQKLNTITRVTILIGIILFLLTRNIWVIVVSGLTVFSIYLYYKKEFNEKRLLKEGYDNPAQVYLKNNGKPVPPTVEIFQKPDVSNPFSNILLPDYEFNTNKKPAPPLNNEMVSDDVLKKAKNLVEEQNKDQPDISDKLFKNINDEFDFEQSMRPFHTTSNTTIPNDQTGFIEFCYGNMISCKEGNLFACARNTSHYNLY